MSKSKYYLGAVGILGDKYANEYFRKSDLLIVVGSRLSERTILNDIYLLKNKHIIYINKSNNYCTYPGISSSYYNQDAALFTEQIIHLTKNTLQDKIRKAAVYDNDVISNELTYSSSTSLIINSRYSECIFCLDDGNYTLQVLKEYKTSEIIFYGSMAVGGSSIGSAIGSAIAESKRKIVVFIGDGGILSVLGEIQTIKKYNLNICIFLFNNGGYESIKQWFGSDYSEEFGLIDFESIAKGFEIDYCEINTINQMKQFLRKDLTQHPQIVEIKIKSEKMIKHFLKVGY